MSKRLSIPAKQQLMARAVYFCIKHNVNPTAYKVSRLTGIGKNNVPKLGLSKIIENYNIILGEHFLSTYSTVCLQKPLPQTEIPLFPTTFTFTPYEVINGLLGYRLSPLDRFVRMDQGLSTLNVSGSLAMISVQLLQEFKLVHRRTNFSKAVRIGASVINLLLATTLRDGRVSCEHPSLRFLNALDAGNRIIHRGEDRKCDGLFYRNSRTGTIATGSFKHLLSKRGETFMQQLISRYTSLVLGETKLPILPHDLLVDIDTLKSLHIRDQVVLLSKCSGTRDGKLHVVNQITDTADSRVYGVMTMLTSRARTSLGYHQYDIEAALQSIVFDVIVAKVGPGAEKRFKHHFRMTCDRKKFRQEIADEVGKDVSWVKTALTKIDNGGKVSKRITDRSPTLAGYIDEARPFVDAYMSASDPEMVERAKRHTKIHNVDNKFVAKYIGTKFHADGRKIFGLFFFTWTQVERDIREIIKDCIPGYCHDVHDAVATKETVSLDLLNRSIRDAGFEYVKVGL